VRSDVGTDLMLYTEQLLLAEMPDFVQRSMYGRLGAVLHVQ
jgi:hypothetical protein